MKIKRLNRTKAKLKNKLINAFSLFMSYAGVTDVALRNKFHV